MKQKALHVLVNLSDILLNNEKHSRVCFLEFILDVQNTLSKLTNASINSTNYIIKYYTKNKKNYIDFRSKDESYIFVIGFKIIKSTVTNIEIIHKIYEEEFAYRTSYSLIPKKKLISIIKSFKEKVIEIINNNEFINQGDEIEKIHDSLKDYCNFILKSDKKLKNEEKRITIDRKHKKIFIDGKIFFANDEYGTKFYKKGEATEDVFYINYTILNLLR